MTTLDYGQLISGLLPAVAAAARIQLAHRAAGFTVDHKSDASPVTAADRESEALITRALTALMPAAAVIGEEAVGEGHVPGLTDPFFLVDPLDGTREYVAGNDDFTINIALISASVPVFGIVAAAALGEIFLTVGPGAAIAGRLEQAMTAEAAGHAIDLALLSPRPIATRAPAIDNLTVIASRSHRTARLEEALARVPCREQLVVGSSLKFCRVAEGRADVYPRYGSICEWDTAAGHAVLAAAGGAVTTLEVRTIPYGKAAEGFRQPSFVAWGRATLSEHLSFA